MEKLRPKVGNGIYILNSKNQVLMMKETRAESGTTWCPPGGHLEMGEEFLDWVKREAKEEVNLDIIDAELWAVNNNIFLPAGHYLNLDFLVKSYTGEPKIMEPEKCSEIGWFDLNNLPKPLLGAPETFFANNPPCLCRSGKKFKDCHGKNFK